MLKQMSMNDKNTLTRAGFVAVIGLPNAGKSTLINAMVGAKVSIVSRKVQTTRDRILGIMMHGTAQIILIDTPGIFTPQKTLEKAMVKTAWGTIPDADIIMHIVDAAQADVRIKNADIQNKLPQGKLAILVLNKIDKIDKETLLTLSADLNAQHNYAATFMISALKKDGLDHLTAYIADNLPQNPYLYDPEQITDMPLRFTAAEITREKIFDRLHQELPYAIMVDTESWEQVENGTIHIAQVIYVQRDSQKGIVLGKGGSQIKAIGKAARLELEDMLEAKVNLKLFVKVKPDWPEKHLTRFH
jgi:GTP-binding protein Era